MPRFSPPLSVAAFRARFPEFGTGALDTEGRPDGATDALIQSKLDDADTLVAPDAWGQKAYTGAYYLAAHLLALSPFAVNMRLASDNGETTYGKVYGDMLKSVNRGPTAI